jgi:hypothetical protein
MSYEHFGRSYRTREDHHRAQTDYEADALRRINSQLRNEASRLGRETSALRGEMQSAKADMRKAAVAQAKLEERHREMRSLQQQLDHRQREFETRTVEREQELENEMRAVEHRTEEQIAEVRAETDRKIAAVQQDLGDVRAEMNQGFSEVEKQIRETAQHLDKQIGAVRSDLEAEQQRRIEKETGRATKAEAVAKWLENQMQTANGSDSLGLAMEWTRTLQHLERTRESLKGEDKEMAWPIAQTAFASYQTLYLETERRIGVIEGVAEHLSETSAMLSAIALNDQFRMLFAQEAAQIESAVAWLKRRSEHWRQRRQWTVFEVEREPALDLANQLLIRALELEALVPSLLKQLQSRELRLKGVGAAVASIAGAADKFETSYANPEDPKSPRLLRARVGTACVDTYLGLDGTYRIDAYGFSSHGECAQAAERMGSKLAVEWQVDEQRVDSGNRQHSSGGQPEGTESWRQISSDLMRMSGKFTDEK